MKNTYLFILFLLTANLSAQRVSEFEHFEIDINAPRVSFFETIKHVEIIRLEETKNSLLSDVWWYFKTPSGMGTVNEKSHTVVLFDHEGNYKNIISRYGRGPTEYINISDVWYNNGKIELFSGGSRLIQRYTEDGEYIETLKGKYGKEIYGVSMIPYQGGYLFHQIDPYSGKKGFNYYGLIFLDSQLNMIEKGAPATVSFNPSPLNLRKRFSELEQSFFYRKPLNDTVFEIKDGNLYPRFKFDFSDLWAWSEPQNTSSFKRAMNTTVNSDKVVEVLPDIGKRYIVLTYFIGLGNKQKGYIKRETGAFTRFDMRKKNKENYELKFLEWEDDRLVSYMAAYDFEEFIGNLNKDQWTIKGGFSLDEIFYSENPVLLSIKFKENIEK